MKGAEWSLWYFTDLLCPCIENTRDGVVLCNLLLCNVVFLRTNLNHESIESVYIVHWPCQCYWMLSSRNKRTADKTTLPWFLLSPQQNWRRGRDKQASKLQFQPWRPSKQASSSPSPGPTKQASLHPCRGQASLHCSCQKDQEDREEESYRNCSCPWWRTSLPLSWSPGQNQTSQYFLWHRVLPCSV